MERKRKSSVTSGQNCYPPVVTIKKWRAFLECSKFREIPSIFIHVYTISCIYIHKMREKERKDGGC